MLTSGESKKTEVVPSGAILKIFPCSPVPAYTFPCASSVSAQTCAS